MKALSMMNKDGTDKLADFGIAAKTDGAADGTDTGVRAFFPSSQSFIDDLGAETALNMGMCTTGINELNQD